MKIKIKNNVKNSILIYVKDLNRQKAQI